MSNTNKTKIVGYRVKKIHVRALNEHVRKFLLNKNYKLYAKRSNKRVGKKTGSAKQEKRNQTVTEKPISRARPNE